MHVESCCQALLSNMLPELDRDRAGAAIDIGVGTFAFYCELFDRLGFKTIAAEPLPTDHLRRVCRSRNIRLIETCVSEADGLVDMYVGSFNGQENFNLNSMRSDWWGSSASTRKVRSMTLGSLLAYNVPDSITCMKIDVEGMELSIIKQLQILKEPMLPKAIMFEYGGGGTREKRQGGWSDEMLGETIKCMEVMRSLGYGQSIMVDSAADTKERIFDLQSVDIEPEAMFLPQCIYGNIICLRRLHYPENKIDAICRPYRENNFPPPELYIHEGILRRAYYKLRWIILQTL